MAVLLTPITASTQREDLLTNGLRPLLGRLEEMEVWDERARVRSTTLAELAYENLDATVTPEVIRNRVAITSGFTVNNAAGSLTFSSVIDTSDDILVSYTFKYFTDDDLNDFLDMALTRINNVRPVTAFDFDDNDAPTNWFTMIIEMAYAFALETMLKDLITWKAALIFRNPEQVANLIQAIVNRIWTTWMQSRKQMKGRQFINVKAVASGRWRLPRTVSGANWQQFTVVRGT